MMSNYNPIFIICTGRSGSTLLRYILDTHDMIDAPQELHLGPMIKEMQRVTSLLFEDNIPNGQDKKSFLNNEVRLTVEKMMRSSIDNEIWCDKSVSSIDYLNEIMAVFPKARYIFLYRDCLDFVHSALEVSKYGFKGFWFEDFILRNPENIVDGLVNFWCLQTEKRIKLVKEASCKIYPIKYEDIVNTPEESLESLFKFLELSFNKDILKNMFVKFRAGSGDLKAQSSNKINKNIGNGKYVPIKKINEESFQRMNKVLNQIGYAEVDRNSNFTSDGLSLTDDLHEYSINKLQDYFLSILFNHTPPNEIKEDVLFIDIIGVGTSPWLIDLKDRKLITSSIDYNVDSTHIKIKINSLLKMVDKNLNISMAYRDGILETNASYQKLNELGKYLFG